MYIIIVGATDLGKYLAKTLTSEGHDIIIIDQDKTLCEKTANELEIVVTNGNATNSEVLEEANIKECNAIVVLTNHDETNMIISLLAKDLREKLVVSRLSK